MFGYKLCLKNEIGKWICLQLQSYNALGTLEITKMGIPGREVSNYAVTITLILSYSYMFGKELILLFAVYFSS